MLFDFIYRPAANFKQTAYSMSLSHTLNARETRTRHITYAIFRLCVVVVTAAVAASTTAVSVVVVVVKLPCVLLVFS